MLFLTSALVLLVLVALTTLAVAGQHSTQRSLKQGSLEKLQAIDALAATAVGGELGALEDLVATHGRRESTLTALSRRGAAELRAALESLKAASPNIFSASLYDASGTLLALQPAVPGVVGRNFAFRDWYKGAVGSRRTYLSESFQLVTPTAPWAVAAATVVNDRHGRRVGVLVATYTLVGLQTLVGDFAAAHGVSMTVVDRRGQLLATAVPALLAGHQAGGRLQDARLTGLLDAPPASLPTGVGNTATLPHSTGTTADRTRLQWAAATLPRIGGVLLAEQPESAALAGYAGEPRRNALVLGVVLVVAVGLLGLLGRAERARRRVLENLGERQAFLNGLLDSLDAGVTACDAYGRLSYVNQLAADRHGTSVGQLLTADGSGAVARLRRPDGSLLPPDEHPLLQALHHGAPVTGLEYVLNRPGWAPCTLTASARALQNPGGETVGAVVVSHDISALRAQQVALQQAQQWSSALLSAAPMPVLVTGLDGVVRQANEACVTLTGRPLPLLVGQTPDDWLHPAPGQDPHVRAVELLAQAIAPAQGTVSAQVRRPTGQLRDVEIRTEHVSDPDGRVVLLSSVTDVTAHRQERAVLHRQSHTDALTGLANRYALRHALQELLIQGTEQPDAARHALVFLDLDGFKAVNDALGHPAGDALLTDVAAGLVAASRKDDLVARLGGDEFVVLARVHAEEDGLELTHRLRTAVREATRRITAPAQLTVDVSLGTAFPGPDGWDPAELIATADRRMYAAKNGEAVRSAVPQQRPEAVADLS